MSKTRILLVRKATSGLGDRIRIDAIIKFLLKSGFLVDEAVIPSLSPNYIKKNGLSTLLTSMLPLKPTRPYEMKHPLIQYFNVNLARNFLNHVSRNSDFDLILAETSLVGWLTLKYTNRKNKPVVIDVHGLEGAEWRGRNERFWHLREALETEALSGCDHLLVASNEMKKAVMRKMRIPERKFSVVLNGSNVTGFQAAFNQPLKVIFAGILDYWENVDSFLDVAKGVDPEAFKFFLAGDGPMKQHLLERIKREQVPIQYLGCIPRSQMLKVLSQMQIGFIPSSRDVARVVAFPIKLLDYMSCGLPVIGPKIGDWGRTIEVEDCGVALEEDTTENYVAALEYMNSRSIWERKSINGINALRTRYTWDKVLSPLHTAIVELAK